MKFPRLERGSYHSDDQLQIYGRDALLRVRKRFYRVAWLSRHDLGLRGRLRTRGSASLPSDQPEFHFPGLADHVLVPGWIPN